MMQTAENGAGSERLASSSPDTLSLCRSANVCRLAGGRGQVAPHLHSTYPFLRDFSGTAMAQKTYFAGGKICVCKQNPLNRLIGAKKRAGCIAVWQ